MCFDTEPFQKALYEALPPEKRQMRDGDIYVVEGDGVLVVFHCFRSYGRNIISVIPGRGHVVKTDIAPRYYGVKEAPE